MYRFYIDHIHGDKVALTDTGQLHHLKDVLRLKVNDEVIVCDSEGQEYGGVISGIGRKSVAIKVKPVKSKRHNKTNLTVACAIPKDSRMDDIIDYLTQLGVDCIIPMRTERVVVKLDGARAEEKHKRWRKIAQSAAQQSQRSSIPLIERAMRFEDVLSKAENYDLKLIPHLSGRRRHIKDVLSKSKPNNIIVLIGPEGDFTPDEVTLALSKGFIAVSLGDTVLRVAAAAIAAASYIQFTVNG
jgi:16S rRNA (uracil1498-N3)-methyltransferase